MQRFGYNDIQLFLEKLSTDMMMIKGLFDLTHSVKLPIYHDVLILNILIYSDIDSFILPMYARGNENISGIVAQGSIIYLEFNAQNPGVCYTATECSALGGTLGSACASGFGVCCTFSGQTQHSIM